MTIIIYNSDGVELTRYDNISRISWDKFQEEMTIYRYGGWSGTIKVPGKVELICREIKEDR